jgi:hypothetical protein
MNIINKMSQQITTNVSETTSTTKNKKGKNLVVKGERQIYCSFLHVSQDPTTSIGQIYQLHFGIGFVSTTIKIDLLAKLTNLLNLLKQNGE